MYFKDILAKDWYDHKFYVNLLENNKAAWEEYMKEYHRMMEARRKKIANSDKTNVVSTAPVVQPQVETYGEADESDDTTNDISLEWLRVKYKEKYGKEVGNRYKNDVERLQSKV